METLFKLADLFLPLPEDKQQEIIDFAEFLYSKHTINDLSHPTVIPDKEIIIEPSEKLKKLLMERLAQHRQNPQLAKNWNTLKTELLNKYK
jgi:hypothetical protein